MIFFFLHTGESPRDARRSQYFLLFPLSLCVFHFFSRHRNALFGVGTRGWGGETHTHTHKGNRCIGDARRSLIFYDCLKCSASHNFAFADSNSRCVLSWRLRISRGSLSLSRFRLVISSAILLNSQEDLEIHLTDSIVCPLHDPIIFFFFISCCLCCVHTFEIILK